MARTKCSTSHQGASSIIHSCLFLIFFFFSFFLKKYDRIDPAEVQSLRDEIAKLKEEATAAQEKISEKEAVAEASAKRVSLVEY